MFRFISQIAAVLLLVVAGAIAPAAAEERLFNASGAGFYDTHSGSMYSRFKATHLGKANFYGSVFPDYLDNSQIFGFPVDLTAANGDRLFLDSVVDYVLDYDTGIGIAIGTLTFTGGTGRFETATGNADVMFVFDTIHQRFLFLIDGSIDY
jgi:hypothetical protein